MTAKSAPAPPPPLLQLGLVHDELNRQREGTVDKHRTMYQRASLLIGACTLVTGVQAARFPEAIGEFSSLLALAEPSVWALTHTGSAVVLAFAATAFALVGALLGIRTITVEAGGEIDIERLAVHVLGEPADYYTAEWSLVRDKIEAHHDDVERLESRRRMFMKGSSMLVVSWLLAILQFALSSK